MTSVYICVCVCVCRVLHLLEKERHTIFKNLLHMADVSHPGKLWHLHHEWTVRITEEFHRQGDTELEMGLPISPLCDRTSTNLPNSQICKISFILFY